MGESLDAGGNNRSEGNKRGVSRRGLFGAAAGLGAGFVAGRALDRNRTPENLTYPELEMLEGKNIVPFGNEFRYVPRQLEKAIHPFSSKALVADEHTAALLDTYFQWGHMKEPGVSDASDTNVNMVPIGPFSFDVATGMLQVQSGIKTTVLQPFPDWKVLITREADTDKKSHGVHDTSYAVDGSTSTRLLFRFVDPQGESGMQVVVTKMSEEIFSTIDMPYPPYSAQKKPDMMV